MGYLGVGDFLFICFLSGEGSVKFFESKDAVDFYGGGKRTETFRRVVRDDDII